MKTIIVISALLFAALSSHAQTKTPAPAAPAAPVKTFSIKGLNGQQVQNIFEICTLLKQSVPYNSKIDDASKNVIQLNVDAFTTFLTGRITQDSVKVLADTSKNKTVKPKKPKS